MRKPNSNLRSVSIQNYKIILRDTFKWTWNVILRALYSFDCGLMDLQFRFYNPKHFVSEVTLDESSAFPSCCHKGKSKLSAVS